MERKGKLKFKIDKYNIVETEKEKFVVDKYLQSNPIKETIDFPGKIIFSNFKDKNIQIRKQKLEQYLNKLASCLNLLELGFAKEFLEFVESSKPATADPHPQPQPPPVQDEKRQPESPPMHRRSESMFVYEFLSKLNRASLEVAKVAQGFETLYFSAALPLTASDIRLLFLGEDRLNGLLYFCGDTKNYIASRSCLHLFSKLIAYDYNSLEADKFVAVFCSVEPDVVRKMNLGHAIKEIKAQNGPGQTALYQYLIGNTHGITEPKQILDDDKAIEEYEKWITKKSITSHVVKHVESFSHSESSKDEQARSMAALLSKSLGQTKITKLLVESSNLSALNDMKELMDQQDNFAAWKLVDVSELVKTYVKGTKNIRFTFRLRTTDIKLAARYFYELDKRDKWDPVHWAVLKKDNDYQDIVQLLYPLPVKKFQYVEYVLFRNIGRSEDGKSIIIISRSLILPQSPVQTIKRTHVNACLCRIALKNNEQSGPYTECTMLWRVEEGYENLAIYTMWNKKMLEEKCRLLNDMISSGA